MTGLVEQLKIDEGFELKPYWDPIGKVWTVGYGHNLMQNITEDQALDFLISDIDIAEESLDKVIPQWESFSTNRRNALLNMMFNMGQKRFSGFKKMRDAIDLEDWPEAAKEAKDSVWYGQVGNRAKRIVALLEKG